MIAAAPLTPALASPPPTPTVTAKVTFAKNLKEKLKTAKPLTKLAEGKYSQQFGNLYVQESPWLELGPFWLLLPGHPAVAESTPSLSASEAFALIKKA
jgi:hypothetical protein